MVKRKILFVLALVLIPAIAFGQTALEKYQEAKAFEYRSDRAKTANEKSIHIQQAFSSATEAALGDAKYVGAFAQIARKYVARSREANPYFYMSEEVLKVGLRRDDHPAFRAIALEVVQGYQRLVSGKGFGPTKPFIQTRRDRYHCNIRYDVEKIFWIGQKTSLDVSSWGKYVADVNMMVLRGCGGEGGDLEPDPDRALPIYVAIKNKAGIHKASKMIGDVYVEKYLFGGYAYNAKGEPQYHNPGDPLIWTKARKTYTAGGVLKAEIRSAILGYLRRAEQEKNKDAAKLAEKLLASTF